MISLLIILFFQFSLSSIIYFLYESNTWMPEIGVFLRDRWLIIFVQDNQIWFGVESKFGGGWCQSTFLVAYWEDNYFLFYWKQILFFLKKCFIKKLMIHFNIFILTHFYY